MLQVNNTTTRGGSRRGEGGGGKSWRGVQGSLFPMETRLQGLLVFQYGGGGNRSLPANQSHLLSAGNSYEQVMSGVDSLSNYRVRQCESG